VRGSFGDDPAIDGLLAAVVAQPASVGPRLVLADVLTERGDPRGEFIALQCLQAPSDVQRKRAMALLRRHHTAWVGGGLELVLDDRTLRFERGFLHAATIRRSPVWMQDQVHIRPEHTLIRSLAVIRDFVPDEAPLDRLLPRFRGLRELVGLNATELTAVLADPPALRTLGVADFDRDAMSALLHAPLEQLETLALEAHGRTAVVSALLDRMVGVRHLRVGVGEIRSWRDAMMERPLASLEVRVRGWRLVLSGDRLAHLEAWPIAELTDDPAGSLADALHTLPIRSVSYIHVRGGRRPMGDGVRRVRRAAKGTPIRLPPSWEAADDA
jgi:uncharacterized protein (TIGR02996 family)